MREAAAWTVGREIEPRQMSAARRAVGDDRALLIGEAERLANRVQMVIEVVDPKADAVLIARAHGIVEAAEANQVAVGKIGVGLRHRAALDIVGLEQLVGGDPAQHVSELPGEVVRILHAGVQAEAAGRRKTMRGIADHEHTVLAKHRRDLLAHAPDRTVEQRDVEIGHADMGADDLDRLGIGPRPRPLVLLLADLDH